MNILIANDDGVFAPGIQALANALRPLGRGYFIVAPEAERSGFSSALTLDRPLVSYPNCHRYLGCEWHAGGLRLFIHERLI